MYVLISTYTYVHCTLYTVRRHKRLSISILMITLILQRTKGMIKLMRSMFCAHLRCHIWKIAVALQKQADLEHISASNNSCSCSPQATSHTLSTEQLERWTSTKSLNQRVCAGKSCLHQSATRIPSIIHPVIVTNKYSSSSSFSPAVKMWTWTLLTP